MRGALFLLTSVIAMAVLGDAQPAIDPAPEQPSKPPTENTDIAPVEAKGLGGKLPGLGSGAAGLAPVGGPGIYGVVAKESYKRPNGTCKMYSWKYPQPLFDRQVYYTDLRNGYDCMKIVQIPENKMRKVLLNTAAVLETFWAYKPFPAESIQQQQQDPPFNLKVIDPPGADKDLTKRLASDIRTLAHELKDKSVELVPVVDYHLRLQDLLNQVWDPTVIVNSWLETILYDQIETEGLTLPRGYYLTLVSEDGLRCTQGTDDGCNLVPANLRLLDDNTGAKEPNFLWAPKVHADPKQMDQTQSEAAVQVLTIDCKNPFDWLDSVFATGVLPVQDYGSGTRLNRLLQKFYYWPKWQHFGNFLRLKEKVTVSLRAPWLPGGPPQPGHTKTTIDGTEYDDYNSTWRWVLVLDAPNRFPAGDAGSTNRLREVCSRSPFLDPAEKQDVFNVGQCWGRVASYYAQLDLDATLDPSTAQVGIGAGKLTNWQLGIGDAFPSDSASAWPETGSNPYGRRLGTLDSWLNVLNVEYHMQPSDSYYNESACRLRSGAAAQGQSYSSASCPWAQLATGDRNFTGNRFWFQQRFLPMRRLQERKLHTIDVTEMGGDLQRVGVLKLEDLHCPEVVVIGSKADDGTTEPKCVKAPEGRSLTCSKDAGDPRNRLNNKDLEDTFTITVKGDLVCAKRTDQNGQRNFWDHDLTIYCKISPAFGYVAISDDAMKTCVQSYVNFWKNLVFQAKAQRPPVTKVLVDLTSNLGGVHDFVASTLIRLVFPGLTADEACNLHDLPFNNAASKFADIRTELLEDCAKDEENVKKRFEDLKRDPKQLEKLMADSHDLLLARLRDGIGTAEDHKLLKELVLPMEPDDFAQVTRKIVEQALSQYKRNPFTRFLVEDKINGITSKDGTSAVDPFKSLRTLPGSGQCPEGNRLSSKFPLACPRLFSQDYAPIFDVQHDFKEIILLNDGFCTTTCAEALLSLRLWSEKLAYTRDPRFVQIRTMTFGGWGAKRSPDKKHFSFKDDMSSVASPGGRVSGSCRASTTKTTGLCKVYRDAYDATFYLSLAAVWMGLTNNDKGNLTADIDAFKQSVPELPSTSLDMPLLRQTQLYLKPLGEKALPAQYYEFPPDLALFHWYQGVSFQDLDWRSPSLQNRFVNYRQKLFYLHQDAMRAFGQPAGFILAAEAHVGMQLAETPSMAFGAAMLVCVAALVLALPAARRCRETQAVTPYQQVPPAENERDVGREP